MNDRTSDAVAQVAGAAGRPGWESTAAALSALHHFLDGASVRRLRQVLGLTSSGTVRLVDKLESNGLATRGAGQDGRTTVVSLTDAGHEAASRVAGARAGVLEHALGVLSAQEREQLDGLVSQVLVGMMREPGATRWTCRLCDTEACGVKSRKCPLTRAAAERFGSARGGSA